MTALLQSAYRFLKKHTKKAEHTSESPIVKSSSFTYQKHIFPHLEVHVSNKCNLGCKFCAHYCDIAYEHIPVDVDATLEYICKWSLRLLPTRFRILGGEPLLEKRLPDFIDVVAYAFPNSKRDLATNAILLDIWKDTLPHILKKTGTTLTISRHPMNTAQHERFEENCNMAMSWKAQYGINIKISNFSDKSIWRKFYRNDGRSIIPFSDNQPYQSRKVCFTGTCTTLYKGLLYQCPPLAYLPDIADTLHNKQAWAHYLRYKPLDFSATDFELACFFHGLHGVDFCAMCPSKKVFVDPSA